MIESGVPKPHAKSEPRWKPLLVQMEPTQSFLVKHYMRPGENEKALLRNIIGAAARLKMAVSWRRGEDGIRVWRDA